MSPRPIRYAVALAACWALTGCSFDGIQSVALPGGTGTGDSALEIIVEIPDVGTLTPNAEVKVDDVAVGTVTSLEVVDWHAEAHLSLEPDVDLPANALAAVGVNSLLGSSYVELAPPESGAVGHLASGDRIPLSRGKAYPATEQVLASASVVLNGGGLEQLGTITRELNTALSGNHLAVRDLLPRMNSFVGALNHQRGDIIAAIHDVDRLAGRFARSRGTITRALDELGPALRTLSEERPDLTRALASLHRLGDVATPLLRTARGDLTANLRDLVPAVQALSRAGDSLARGLGYAVTFPFPTDTVKDAVVADYHNLFATIDLTADAMLRGFVTADGGVAPPGIPGLPTLPGLPGLPGLVPDTSRSSGTWGSDGDPLSGLLGRGVILGSTGGTP